MVHRPYLVGICGGSASGKTSFLKSLVRQLPGHSVSVVSQDNYYIPKENQEIDENGQVNFDLPSSIDRKHFKEDVLALIKGKSVSKMEYTFNNPEATPEEICIDSAPIIVLEGLFIFFYDEIRELLDLKVFIDAREDIQLERRLKRDFQERGYPEETVLYQWNNHVMPSFKKYLQPYRDMADVIITNNTNFDRGLSVLLDHLKQKV